MRPEEWQHARALEGHLATVFTKAGGSHTGLLSFEDELVLINEGTGDVSIHRDDVSGFGLGTIPPGFHPPQF